MVFRLVHWIALLELSNTMCGKSMGHLIFEQEHPSLAFTAKPKGHDILRLQHCEDPWNAYVPLLHNTGYSV